MGRLKTALQFSDAVDAETAWRKHELTQVLFAVESPSARKLELLLTRAAIAMLYAHWEGWIKSVSRLYLKHVNSLSLTYDELSDPFLGNALRGRVARMAESKKSAMHNEFAHFLSSGGLMRRATISPSFARSESNLSSSVLRDLVSRLGVPHEFYQTKEQIIDECLVKQRNLIAHGDYARVSVEDYRVLHDQVLSMLSSFTNEIVNAAVLQKYRREECS